MTAAAGENKPWNKTLIFLPYRVAQFLVIGPVRHTDAGRNTRANKIDLQSLLTDECGDNYSTSLWGLTPLHFAVVLGGQIGVEMTRILLESGANPNLRAESDDSFLVEIENSIIIIKMLMDEGADPNLPCNGQCALSLAIVTGNDEAALLLLTYQQTKPDLALSHGLGSSLCLLLHPMFEDLRSFESRLGLLRKLIERTAHGIFSHRIVVPELNVEGNIVDYVYYQYGKCDCKEKNNSAKLRKIKDRQETLKFLAAELRKSAFESEIWKQSNHGRCTSVSIVEDQSESSYQSVNDVDECSSVPRLAGKLDG
ncbi:hypothetical protein Aperf_G00000049840 [Anoplocephala perfoliata]